jgi:hypothetical protein
MSQQIYRFKGRRYQNRRRQSAAVSAEAQLAATMVAEVEFSVTGLDAPLRSPTAIFTAPDDEIQYLYVADAGNQRIVQLEKDGRFLRQFKPSLGEAVTFANLQDIFVDEIGGRLYILDNNNLYVGNMPTVE